MSHRIWAHVLPTVPDLHAYDEEFYIYDAHCPLRKGIICYHRDGTIFEHNIRSSGKHEPRIIIPKHPSRRLAKISFVPIKGNRILLFAKYSARRRMTHEYYLHLSIHEIRSDHRVGPALWSFNGSVDGHFNIVDLELIKSSEYALGITFWVRFDDHWKLFDISTTETGASNNFPLIESGRIDFDLKFKLKRPFDGSPVILSPDTRILLNVDMKYGRPNEAIDIHHLDSSNTNFSFVTRLSVPVADVPFADVPVENPSHNPPVLAFSPNGSKFAMAMALNGVFVWDIRSKVPLQTFTKTPLPKELRRLPIDRYPQFSSGNSGKEILVFVEHDDVSHFAIIHVIDATLFEMEEKLVLKYKVYFVGALFFDPSEGTLYAELDGTIYKWDLQKNEPSPKWWTGEE